ncbi:MAG: hypothetical protein EBR09_14205 [Proteobacteria bacterium]|nr:hypothetical protein [Pseudomonadota bacterium]
MGSKLIFPVAGVCAGVEVPAAGPVEGPVAGVGETPVDGTPFDVAALRFFAGTGTVVYSGGLHAPSAEAVTKTTEGTKKVLRKESCIKPPRLNNVARIGHSDRKL